MGRFTLLECDGVGVAVQGSAYSVGLAFSDARRWGDPTVWLLGVDGVLVGLGTDLVWEASEVDHAEG